jgi:hypothetical protein
MATQEKMTGTAPTPGPANEASRRTDAGGDADQHSRLGQTLGRAGTVVGDSLSGVTRRGEGDADGWGGRAPRAAAAAALSAVATLAGTRLLERPRRRVAGIPVPGTRRGRGKVVKDLARRLSGRA